MYVGYLRFGENLIINNELTRGYAEGLDCPMMWFQKPFCDTLNDALEDPPYDTLPATDVPWYDPKLASESQRFLGVYGLDFQMVQDSTRQVPTVEGITDGGVIGRTRKGMKRMRMRAILVGQGRDALDYGVAWLNAAIDPDACGQVSTKCGTADLEWLTDCPRERGVTATLTNFAVVNTNLARNGSFEGASGTVEVYRNLVPNPRAVSGGSGFVVAGSPTLPTQSFITDFPGTTNTAVRATVGAGGVTGLFGPLVQLAVSTQYTIRMQVRASGPVTGIDMRVRPGGVGATAGEAVWVTNLPDLPAGVSTITATGLTTATAPIASAAVGLRWSTAPAGTTVDITEIQIVAGPKSPGYFDGTIENVVDPDLNTVAWVGTVNNSASTLSGTGMTNTVAVIGAGIQSGDWFSSGAKSLRAIATTSSTSSRVRAAGPFPAVIGQTYTVKAKARLLAPLTGTLNAQALKIEVFASATNSFFRSDAAPNSAGVHDLSVTFVADATGFDVRLWNGSSVGNGDVWWDDLVIVQGDYTGPFFDGDTADDPSDPPLYRYSWTGTIHDSTSTLEQRNFVDVPESDEDYFLAVDELRRFLRTSAAESGPIIAAEYRRDNWFAYEVEVDFVSETPHILGLSNTIPLDPAAPSVVQDIVFNLIQTPSAERPGPDVVVQTNYATNPSVETDAIGWSPSTLVITPAASGARSTPPGDPAANGQYSYKVSVVATNAGTVGIIAANQDVVLPAYVTGQRFSFSMWGFLQLVTGTASLTGIRFQIEWRDAGNLVVSTVTVGTLPSSGGAIPGVAIVRPPTATSVRCIMQGQIASWSIGASLALFADALIVTMP